MPGHTSLELAVRIAVPKKNQDLMAFNHRGTDILVTPAVFNVLKGLTAEVKTLKDNTNILY